MANAMDKNIVYCYNSKRELKEIKTFDTLEECFAFIREQSVKHTVSIKANLMMRDNQSSQLDLF